MVIFLIAMTKHLTEAACRKIGSFWLSVLECRINKYIMAEEAWWFCLLCWACEDQEAESSSRSPSEPVHRDLLLDRPASCSLHSLSRQRHLLDTVQTHLKPIYHTWKEDTLSEPREQKPASLSPE